MLWIWENRISAEEERKCSHPLWALCMEEDQHIQLGGVLVSVQSHPRKSCYLLVTHVTCCCVPSPGLGVGIAVGPERRVCHRGTLVQVH